MTAIAALTFMVDRSYFLHYFGRCKNRFIGLKPACMVQAAMWKTTSSSSTTTT